MSQNGSLQVVIGLGPTGRGVAERLAAEGRRVRVVSRSGRASVPEGVEGIAADVSDKESAKRACDGASVVFACVGLPGYVQWVKQWPVLMAGMLEGAASSGARFVFVDNLYMYGPVNGPLREDLPLTDYGVKPALRSTITRMWQAAHEAGRVRAVAVRASDFYGPRVRNAALGDYVIPPALAGKAANVVGDPDQPHTFTYITDVVRALVDVADAEEDVLGQAWHVPSAPARPVREVVELVFREAGHPVKIRVARPWMLRLLGLVDPNMAEMKEMLYEWTGPYEVDHSKFAARFWGDYTPLDEGIRETVRWFRSQI
jgi:nucleoside-diphosphate-sugar epimerase